MVQPAKQILDVLGPAGLARALDDLLDARQLVRLANSCGLNYRGMRTQTQRRERLVADLVAKVENDDVARRAVLHALRKETAQAANDWVGLSPKERAARLANEGFLEEPGSLGLHLFLVAASGVEVSPDGGDHREVAERLLRLAVNGASRPAAPALPSQDEPRMRRKLAALEKKVRHAEAQLTKSRELHRTLKRDLIQRKGELAESRMLAERLRRDLAAARTDAEVATAKNGRHAPPDPTVEELAKAVRKLENSQRKLVHALGSRKEPPPAPPLETAASLKKTVERVLETHLERQRTEITKRLAAQSRRIEELRGELHKIEESAPRRTVRRSRAKGSGARVGVFIDVQNVYYGARRLKGKLDFEALLQSAVRDRRLIQAQAYVVESGETDQSQFIARLEQLAIKVQRKPLRVRTDGSMKGDWDMELALDALDAAPALDVVVLVSGDGDFTSLVKRIKGMGPRVEVIGFPRHTAKSLVEAADEFHPLDRRSMISVVRAKRGGTRREERAATAEPAAAPGEANGSPSPAEEQVS